VTPGVTHTHDWEAIAYALAEAVEDDTDRSTIVSKQMAALILTHRGDGHSRTNQPPPQPVLGKK
jgi:hypothetical protein